MPVKIKSKSGIESSPKVLRYVLQAWKQTDSLHGAQEVLSYFRGFAQIDPGGKISREVNWLVDIIRIKAGL